MDKNEFRAYLRDEVKLQENTIRYYMSCLTGQNNLVTAFMKKNDVEGNDIFEIDDVDEFEQVVGALFSDDKFVDFNKGKHNSYSASLKNLCQYVDDKNVFGRKLKIDYKGASKTKTSPHGGVMYPMKTFARNRIVFGAPGTGKSYCLEDERKKLLGSDNETHFERVTFYPDYSYANFVGTYKPVTKEIASNAEDDADTRAVVNVLTDKTKSDQEKYDELFERFKDGGNLTRLPLLLSLYSATEFETRKEDGSPTANNNIVEINHGKALQKYVKPYSCDEDKSSEIVYEFVPGPFIRVYVEAKKHPEKPYLLLIEEINRANAAAVFGDVFQLLDRGSDGASMYEVHASKDLKEYLARELGCAPEECTTIRIPENMYIWATMNSADQGVYPLDTAFKRRWDFEYIGIDDNDAKLNGKYVVLGAGTYERCVEWNSLRKAINDCLAKKDINEDKQLGPYFIGSDVVVPESGDDIDAERFVKAFKDKVLMYLYEDAARQKRGYLFGNGARYSEICKNFDTKGIFVFCGDISSNKNLKFKGSPTEETAVDNFEAKVDSEGVN